VYLIGQLYEWMLTTCELQPYGQSYVMGLLENLGEDGRTVWQRRIKAGNPGRPGGAGIAPFTGAKVVHVTDAGVFIGANVRKLRFAGDVRREPHRDQSVCSDPGADENAGFQGYDGYIRRYDHDGRVLWTRQFGSNLYELVSGLGSDDGRVYAAGLTRCVVAEGADPETGAPVDGFVVSLAIDPDTRSGRLQLIVGQVDTLSDADRIDTGVWNALVTHLESALSALDNSNTQVAKAALATFVQLVANYRATGTLTGAEADALTGAALAIAGEL
jgi:FIMAH domain